MTALTIYGSNVTGTTLATTCKLATAGGGAEVNVVTTAPTGSGYMEIQSQTATGTIVGSLPAPTGHGWLLDSTLLEANTIAAGNWSATIAIADTAGGGGVSAIVVRAYKRSSGGAYTAIGSITLGTPTLHVTRTVYTFSATSFPATAFATGDKLYIDLFISASGWGGDTIAVYLSSSSSTGVTDDLNIVTSGYAATPIATAITITNAGLNLLRDAIAGANNAQVTYVAVGSGTSTPSNINTQLDAELGRKAVTSYTNVTTGEIKVDCYLAPGDFVGSTINEIGFFGGNSASTATNSGVLFGRVLWSPTPNPKTATTSIIQEMDLTI